MRNLMLDEFIVSHNNYTKERKLIALYVCQISFLSPVAYTRINFSK